MKYKCRICEKEIELLKSHLKNTHGKMNINEYYLEYEQEKTIYENYMISSKIERQKRSPNSIHFYLGKGFTNQESIEKLKEHNLNNPFKRNDISPRHKQYWINRGFSVEESVEKIHILNSNGLDNLIYVYGETEGLRRYKTYKDGQSRKSNTILKKIMQENNITLENAKEIVRNKMTLISPKSLRYWMKLGYSPSDAKIEMYKIGRKTSPRSLDYWMIKTNNDDKLAIEMLKNYQDNNSLLKISIKKGITLDEAQEVQTNIFNRMLETLYSKNCLVRPELKDDFKKYKQYVQRLSEINYRRYAHRIDPLNLRSNDYHLDHKFSIFQGFFDNIDYNIIASPFNLEIKTSHENCSKQRKCDITISELIEKINNKDYGNKN